MAEGWRFRLIASVDNPPWRPTALQVCVAGGLTGLRERGDGHVYHRLALFHELQNDLKKASWQG